MRRNRALWGRRISKVDRRVSVKPDCSKMFAVFEKVVSNWGDGIELIGKNGMKTPLMWTQCTSSQPGLARIRSVPFL